MVPPPIQRSADHRYTKDGVEHPGVTGILNVAPSKHDWLGPWNARMAATAAVEMYEKGALGTLIETTGRDGAIKALSSSANWKRDEAARLGSAVHKLAETREYEHATEGVRKRAEAYADWWNGSGWTRPLVEVMGINPDVGYGGTFDLMARDPDGKLTLADIKTGSTIGRESILQLTAYGMFHLIQYAVGDDWRLVTMPEVERYVILHVTLDGVRPIDINVGQAERMAWLDCVDLARWVGTVKGRL